MAHLESHFILSEAEAKGSVDISLLDLKPIWLHFKATDMHAQLKCTIKNLMSGCCGNWAWLEDQRFYELEDLNPISK